MHLESPFLTILNNRGVQTMLLVAFLYTISVNYETQVMEESGLIFRSEIVFLLLGIAFHSLVVESGKNVS